MASAGDTLCRSQSNGVRAQMLNSVSVPAGLSDDGLPVGFQVIAPAREDARLYRVAGAVEAMLEERWGGPILTKAPELEVAK